MNIKQSVIEATREIFETMLMMDVTPGEQQASRTIHFHDTVSGIVGMAGGYRGLMAIHAPDSVAMAITGSFLGLEVASVDDDVKDAIGEMANMLAGSVKASLTACGKDVKLSIPTAVCGKEYSLDCPEQSDWVVLPFTSAAGNFLVELQLQEQLDA